MKNIFTISSLISISGALCSCSDPNTQMEFKASIQHLENGQLELVSEVTNYSTALKTLNNIDIDKELHQALDLKTSNVGSGDYIPIDNTISYTINRTLKPEETYKFVLTGSKINQFISGEIDFIVNNDLWHFRSVSVGCCR